jgi:murein L,D-transpeptidase YafK
VSSTTRTSRRRYALVGAVLAVAIVVPITELARARPRRREAASTCANASIFVDKSERMLELRCDGQAPQRFAATFGANPVGPKREEGDERTPEGRYEVTSRVHPPRFHRFLGVSYPNASDLAASRALGIRRPGRGIGIHGVRTDLAALARLWVRAAPRAIQWGPTDGCIALANEDVEVVYDAVRAHTPIEIVP